MQIVRSREFMPRNIQTVAKVQNSRQDVPSSEDQMKPCYSPSSGTFYKVLTAEPRKPCAGE